MKRRRSRTVFPRPHRPRREKLVAARVTEREFEHLNKLAAQRGCSASVILRLGLLRMIRSGRTERLLAKQRGDLASVQAAGR